MTGYNLSPGSDKKYNDSSFVEILGCQQHTLLIHSHLEALSLAWVITMIDIFLSLPANTHEPSAANFSWVTVCPPSFHPTLLNKFLIFSELPLVGLCHVFLPRYRQLPLDHLLRRIRNNNQVWPKLYSNNMIREFQVLIQTNK